MVALRLGARTRAPEREKSNMKKQNVWAACAALGVGGMCFGQAISFSSSKAENYLQTGDGVITPYNDWSCVLAITGNVPDAFSNCTINYAGPLSPLAMGIVGNSIEYGQTWYGYSNLNPSLADLDTEIPPGPYEFAYEAGALPGGTHVFELPPSAFCPEAPELLGDTYSRLQSYKNDLASDFTGSMGGFTDDAGANASAISLLIYGAGQGGVFWSASAAPTETSFTIPGGTIEEGRAYFGVMYYTVSFSSLGAGVEGGSHTSSFSRNVFFYFNTRGPCPADLNGDGMVDDEDFVLFVQAYNLLYCSDPAAVNKCPADLTNDGYVVDDDFVEFVPAYNQLLCEPR